MKRMPVEETIRAMDNIADDLIKKSLQAENPMYDTEIQALFSAKIYLIDYKYRLMEEDGK